MNRERTTAGDVILQYILEAKQEAHREGFKPARVAFHPSSWPKFHAEVLHSLGLRVGDAVVLEFYGMPVRLSPRVKPDDFQLGAAR